MKELIICSLGTGLLTLLPFSVVRIFSSNIILAILTMFLSIIVMMIATKNIDPNAFINPAPIDPPLNTAVAAFGIFLSLTGLQSDNETRNLLFWAGIIVACLGATLILITSYNFSKKREVPWKQTVFYLLIQLLAIVFISLIIA